MYRIAVGKSEKSNEIIHKDVSWEQIVKKYSSHKVTAKKGGEYVVGGFFSGGIRQEKFMQGRSLLVIDIDKYDGGIDDLAFDLSMLPFRFVAYSSFQHTNDKPRVRVIAPLSRVVTPDEYRIVALDACKQMLVPFEAIDTCSWKPNQAMFAPQHPDGAEFWTMVHEGNDYQVLEVIAVETKPKDDIDDLEFALINNPLDITDEEVDAYLSAYPATGLDYDAWLKVGMAIYHQYQGSEVGLERWREWSKQDAERFDPNVMSSKWKSFGGSSNPVTMASVIHHVKEAGGVVAIPNAIDTLLAEAAEIDSFDQYNQFKQKVCGMNDHILPPVYRSSIISELADNFGRVNKVTKSAITKELSPSKKSISGAVSLPNWVENWVYVENTCSFANSETADYMIKREAFNAKYDREIECITAEKQASQLALVNYKIPTVVDVMFFPKANKFFTYEGKKMMNSFSVKGVRPRGMIDAEGKIAIDLFLAHVAFTLELKTEQRLFLDWMAYIYKNQGKRVGWAMLLQGAQGTGKSYFGNVFEHLMGTNVKSLDTGAISGRFTGWATGALVAVVEEIRIAGTNKYEILDKLKPIISNSAIQIEEKGRDHRTVPNFTSYFLLTNHKDAVPLQDGDRRYCALFSRVQSEEQLFAELGGKDAARKYFDTLFDSLKANADAIAQFLLDWEISPDFDPNGRAPETSARIEMKALSVSHERDLIEDAILKHECKVINDKFIDLTWLNKMVTNEGQELPKIRTVSAVLSELGYSPIEGRRVKLKSRDNHYVWVNGAQCETEKIDVKKIVREFHSGNNDDDFENIPF